MSNHTIERKPLSGAEVRDVGCATRRQRVVLVMGKYRTYNARMYEALADAFDVHVIWINPPPAHEAVPEAIPMRWEIVARNPNKLRPGSLRRNTALFRRVVQAARGADLVVASHSNSWKAQVAFAAARACGVPIALVRERWRDSSQGALTRRLYRHLRLRITDAMERRAVGMLARSTKAAEYLVARGVPHDRIETFTYLHPDWSHLPRDHALIERLRRDHAGRVVFLYLGRVIPRKGLVPLVRAFRSVLATGRDAVLLVVGEAITEDTGHGAVSTSYIAEAKRLAGDDPRIVFLGHVEPQLVHNYYAATDVFVHPHVATVDGHDVHEGWGNVITEAACMSMPIVTTDRVAAAFDIVEPGSNGFVIDSTRIDDDLPRALAPFIDRPELVQEFGRRSRARFEAFIDPVNNIAALDHLIARAGALRAGAFHTSDRSLQMDAVLSERMMHD